MNQKEIISQLEKLKSVNPDQAFFLRSKKTVLAIEPERQRFLGFGLFSPMFLGGAFVVLLAVAAGFLVFFSPAITGMPAYASLNSENLNKELDSLTINIQLQEIQYRQSIEKTVNSALHEVGNSETRHLSRDVLEQEKSAFNALPSSSTSSKTIDALLDKIINNEK